jgi:hypothetical protein
MGVRKIESEEGPAVPVVAEPEAPARRRARWPFLLAAALTILLVAPLLVPIVRPVAVQAGDRVLIARTLKHEPGMPPTPQGWHVENIPGACDLRETQRNPQRR